ncbi:hypothetical protein [Leptospira kirschneri]|uniref:hypothetical protein n=1 Tax=Leptospira kirschneri TaxID=29507 RepID=UPI0002FB7A8A|nr:hypothetical protein [Leptospira kirschneri]
MQELLTSGSANINPKNLSYGGTSTQGFNLFTPDIGSYAFSQWNGNAHIRCIRK